MFPFQLNAFRDKIKTKTMDSPMRRSGIPIPKTKTNNMKKSFSKSNDNLLSDSCDGNQSNELDLFTLLEENIGLKEKNEELMAKHNNSKHLNGLNRWMPFNLPLTLQYFRKMFSLNGKTVESVSSLAI